MSRILSAESKRRFVIIVAPLSRFVAQLFFDKKYLKGKYFNNNHIGWKWVWRGIIWQKIYGFNRQIPWPVSPFVVIFNSRNIEFHIDDLNIFQMPGTYFQNFSGKIIIGEGTYIASNVGLITANHDPENVEDHLPSKDITIGRNCWIGMNAVILPGVVLGDRTTVGAGSVVTKSFIEGDCVIAGNPAKIIKKLHGESTMKEILSE